MAPARKARFLTPVLAQSITANNMVVTDAINVKDAARIIVTGNQDHTTPAFTVGVAFYTTAADTEPPQSPIGTLQAPPGPQVIDTAPFAPYMRVVIDNTQVTDAAEHSVGVYIIPVA